MHPCRCILANPLRIKPQNLLLDSTMIPLYFSIRRLWMQHDGLPPWVSRQIGWPHRYLSQTDKKTVPGMFVPLTWLNESWVSPNRASDGKKWKWEIKTQWEWGGGGRLKTESRDLKWDSAGTQTARGWWNAFNEKVGLEEGGKRKRSLCICLSTLL